MTPRNVSATFDCVPYELIFIAAPNIRRKLFQYSCLYLLRLPGTVCSGLDNDTSTAYKSMTKHASISFSDNEGHSLIRFNNLVPTDTYTDRDSVPSYITLKRLCLYSTHMKFV